MAWPGPQEGLGQGGPRLKWAKGRFGSKNDEKVKVLRMEFSIVENLSGLQESIFNLSRGPQVHFGEKSKNWSNFIKFTDFPPFPLFGVPWAAVILYLKYWVGGIGADLLASWPGQDPRMVLAKGDRG